MADRLVRMVGGPVGRVAVTRNPPPGRGPAASVPSSASARCRIPVSPLPVPSFALPLAWPRPLSSTWTRSSPGRYSSRTSASAGPAWR